MPFDPIPRPLYILIGSLIFGVVFALVFKKMKKLPNWVFIILGVLVIVVLIVGAIFDSASKDAEKKTKETVEYSMHTVDIEPIDIPDVTFDMP